MWSDTAPFFRQVPDPIADAFPITTEQRQESNAPGNPAAIIQERGVSAKRTQADRREGLMLNSSLLKLIQGKGLKLFLPESSELGT